MRINLFVLLLILPLLLPTVAKSSGALTKGQFQAGGRLGLGYSSISGTHISVQPQAQYFLTDVVAVGAEAKYYHTNDSDSVGLGPIATFYFWQNQNWASYISEGLFIGFGSPLAETSIGLNRFIKSNMAIGTSISVTYYLGDDKNTDTTSLLDGHFLIFF